MWQNFNSNFCFREKRLQVCVSGRGDKDVVSIAENLPKFGPKIAW
jgi:tryptophan synthase